MCLSLMKKLQLKRTTSDAKRLRLGKGIIVMKNINFKVILGLIVTTLLLRIMVKVEVYMMIAVKHIELPHLRYKYT